MPRFDGTGPNGEGPLTGGGFGYCDYTDDGRVVRRNSRIGLRRGYGRGYGRGFRRVYGVGRRYFDAYPYEDDTEEYSKEMLNNEKKALEARLKNIGEQLKKLDDD